MYSKHDCVISLNLSLNLVLQINSVNNFQATIIDRSLALLHVRTMIHFLHFTIDTLSEQM